MHAIIYRYSKKRLSTLAIATILSSFTLFVSLSYGEDLHGREPQTHPSGVETLRPELRKLLGKEMLALQTGMKSIIPAYVSGQWLEIEHIAQKMQMSYILMQSLTPKQRQELHESLPEAFIEQDRQFHYLSGMLSEAAKNKNLELVGFYFSKLSESCVGCHRQFAKHRFPAFAPQTLMEQHKH